MYTFPEYQVTCYAQVGGFVLKKGCIACSLHKGWLLCNSMYIIHLLYIFFSSCESRLGGLKRLRSEARTEHVLRVTCVALLLRVFLVHNDFTSEWNLSKEAIASSSVGDLAMNQLCIHRFLCRISHRRYMLILFGNHFFLHSLSHGPNFPHNFLFKCLSFSTI